MSNTVEDRFEALFNLVADPMIIIDNTGKLLAANLSVKEAIGFDPKELVGKSFLELAFLDREDKAILARNFEKRMKGFDVEPYEIKITAKNGVAKYFEVKGKRIEYFEELVNLVVFHDVTQRKKVQRILETNLESKCRDLGESEEKLRSVFASSPDPITVFDLNVNLIDCNPAALNAFGYSTKNEVIGRSALEFIATKDRQRAMENFMPVEKGSVKNVEYMVLGAGGREFPAELSASVLKDSSENPTGFVAIIKDITERKNAEEKLKKLKAFDERIIDSLGEALLVIDPDDFKIINVNKEMLKQLNLRREDLIGKTCYEATHHRSAPCQTPEHICPIRKMQETGSPVTVEHTHFNRQNHVVYVEVSVYPVVGSEGKTVVIHVAKDVTERKLMAQAVIDNEEKFRTISNSVKDALILVDANGRIVFWNPAAEKTFGYTREDTLNRNVHELLAPGSMCPAGRQAIERGLKQFAETGTGAFIHGNVELIGRRKDGFEFPVELSLSPMKMGNKWYAVGVAKDITERKQNEKIARKYAKKLEIAVAERTNELKAANESLLRLERLATIGELAGMVGHDLRNPLTAIKNAAYFLKKKGASIPEAEAKAMLEIIEKGIVHSDKIINDLLDYAREMHLDLQQSPVPQLIDEALAIIKIPEKIRIQKNIPEALSLKVDSNKIERVFINLVKNAIDAMPNGGTITLNCTQANGNVEISFADTGIGMSKETLAKLFTPLFTTKAQGMGFGLAICKRVVEAHGGKISVESVLDKGTTFTVTLPVEPELDGGEKTWINTPESWLSTTTKT
jgi:PAS domain S-box-containing protein